MKQDFLLTKKRTFDLAICYYGGNSEVELEHSQPSFSQAKYFIKNKGGKFANLLYFHEQNPNLLQEYKAIMVLDDDIALSHNDLNRLFEIQQENDLWLLQPSYSRSGKISHEITACDPSCYLRFTNFVEVTCPLFRVDKLIDFLKVYDKQLTGYGIDYWFSRFIGNQQKKRIAIIDEVICRNPFDYEKTGGQREISTLQSDNQRELTWQKVAKKNGIPFNGEPRKTFGRILKFERSWACNPHNLIAALLKFLGLHSHLESRARVAAEKIALQMSIESDLLKQKKRLNQVSRELNKRVTRQSREFVNELRASFAIQQRLAKYNVTLNFAGWSVTPDSSLFLLDRLEENNYDLVIEFGSGVSTMLFSAVLSKQQGGLHGNEEIAKKIVAFENDENYFGKTHDNLADQGLLDCVDLMYAPLKTTRMKESLYHFYDCEEQLQRLSNSVEGQAFKIFVFVDGPPGKTSAYSRYMALPLIVNAFPGCNIEFALDDFRRSDEQIIADRWKLFLEERQLSFNERHIDTQKGIFMLSVKT